MTAILLAAALLLYLLLVAFLIRLVSSDPRIPAERAAEDDMQWEHFNPPRRHRNGGDDLPIMLKRQAD